MTATKSANKKLSFFKNPFIMARIKTNITTNRKLATVISILHLIGYPLVMAMVLYTEYYIKTHTNQNGSYSSPDTDIFIVAGIISGSIALLAGFVVAMNIFKYQYKKSCVDMNLSLPLNSTQRFFTDYLTGLGIYLIPALCAWVLGDLIGLIGLGLKLDDFSEGLRVCNTAGVCVVLAMILFYTLTVFCITCCGSIFEAIASSVLINGVIPAFLFILGYCICNSDPYGVDKESLMYEQIYFTSPFGCMMYVFELFDNGIDRTSLFFNWLVSIIIYISLIVLLTYFLYKKRKAENVSKPYVYKTLYYAITSAMLFVIIYAISFIGNDNYIGSIFIAAIVYFIFEIVTKRGFKKFHYSVFRFIGTVASIFIIVILSDFTNGFGIYKYVPSPAGVSSVYLNQNNSWCMESNIFSYNNYNSSTDKNVIKTVTDIQKKYIDMYENPEKYNENDKLYFDKYENGLSNNEVTCQDDFKLDIKYYMKNGNIVSRKYTIRYEDFCKIKSAVYKSNDFAEYAKEDFEQNYLTSYDNHRNQISFFEAKTDTSFDVKLSKDEFNQLVDAYTTDLKTMTEEEYNSSQIIGYIGYSCEIRENFRNTIAFINEKIPNFHTSPDNFKLSDFAGLNVWVYKNVIPVYYVESLDNTKISDKYFLSSSLNVNTSSMKPFSVGTVTVNPDLEKLINVSQNVYDSEEIGGAVAISGKIYYIPKEYKELVDKVYNELFATVEYYYTDDGEEYYYDDNGYIEYTGYNKYTDYNIYQ